MKARYLLACLTVTMIGCSGDSNDTPASDSDLSNDTPASESDLMASQFEANLDCILQVLCEDGTEFVESVSTESECAVLEARAQDFDRDTCNVILMKEEKLEGL